MPAQLLERHLKALGASEDDCDLATGGHVDTREPRIEGALLLAAPCTRMWQYGGAGGDDAAVGGGFVGGDGSVSWAGAEVFSPSA